MTYDPEGRAFPCYFLLLPTPAARAGDQLSSCPNPVNFAPTNSAVKTVSTGDYEKQKGRNIVSEDNGVIHERCVNLLHYYQLISTVKSPLLNLGKTRLKVMLSYLYYTFIPNGFGG